MHEIVLFNGYIVDGKRNAPFRGSIGIDNGMISEISEGALDGKESYDCTGLYISPGFVDLHQHSDSVPLNNIDAESMINQGVTTEIGGNCGISLFPANDAQRDEIKKFYKRTVEIIPENENLIVDNILDYKAESENHKFSVNIGVLIGHGTLRGSVVGFDDRDATDEELLEMKELLEFELKNGAKGMSLGLIYPPSSYGRMKEFIELSKVLRDYDKILTVHMRNESDKVEAAIDEMIEVAKNSGVHLHISHLKLIGKSQWGNSQVLLDKIEAARNEGCIITCDQYPYEATATGLAALVPQWAQDGGNKKMIERLKSEDERLYKDIATEMNKRGGPSKVTISSTLGHLPEFDGKNMEEISKILNLEPEKAVADVLIKCDGGALAVYHSLNKDDVLNIMKDINIAIGSDGCDFSYDLDFSPHPRSFGTFPRFLQTVRENELMPIEDAIYKITGLPAKILKDEKIGQLEVGKVADITVFDYDTIEDLSTFATPATKPKGIVHVFVNGVPTIVDGIHTKNRAGKVI